MKPLSQLSDEVSRCNRCGFCQEVCPTYAATGQEVSVARGRNHLLRAVAEGRFDLASDPELRTHLYSCLLCGACTVACPPGVRTDKLVTAARFELTRSQGLPLAQRLVLRNVMRSPRRVGVPVSLLRFYQSSGMRSLLRRVGLLGLFRSLDHLDGMVPPVPGRAFRSEHRPGPRISSGRGRRRVAYFLGCVTDNLFPAIARATVAVLERNGYEVTVLDNVCCGAPHLSYGDAEALAHLIRTNVALLAQANAEVIVSDCATCLDNVKKWPEAIGDEDARVGEVSQALAARTRDVSQLLLEDGLEAPEVAVERSVAFHDPCHLVRGLGIRSEPRMLLRSIPGLDYRELPEADRCCGGAGSYAMTHRTLSLAILDRKMASFALTGAQTLATSCPSCLVQLSMGLRRSKLQARVAHPLQLLWQAYGSPPAGARAG